LFDVELKLLLGDVAELGRIHRLDEVNGAALPVFWMTVMSWWKRNKQDENGRHTPSSTNSIQPLLAAYQRSGNVEYTWHHHWTRKPTTRNRHCLNPVNHPLHVGQQIRRVGSQDHENEDRKERVGRGTFRAGDMA
jgi:hypothetical protein